MCRGEERRWDERRWEGCPVLVEGWTDDGQTAGSWRERKRQRRVASLPWNTGMSWGGWGGSDSRPALCFNRPLILAASPTLNFSSQWLKLLTFNNLSHHFDFANSASMGAPAKVALFKMEVVLCVRFSKNSFIIFNLAGFFFQFLLSLFKQRGHQWAKALL